MFQVDHNKLRTYGDKLTGDNGQLAQAPSTSSWFISAEEEPLLVTRLQTLAVSVHRAMRCRDFGQIDCRYLEIFFIMMSSHFQSRVTESGEVYILEVNGFCSFGPLSLVPKIAKNVGISHEDLYSVLLRNAAKRKIKTKEPKHEIIAIGA